MNNDLSKQVQTLLLTSETPELGPGPRPGARPLAELETELRSGLSHSNLPPVACNLVRSLVLLWHDHLDASHTISQSIENPDGSLVHAIMHRREPDYWNSKYWWRRVGKHPCFAEIGKRVLALFETHDAPELRDRLVPRGNWDPGAFVDACAAVPSGVKSSPQVKLLREVQRIETEVALEHFLRGV